MHEAFRHAEGQRPAGDSSEIVVLPFGRVGVRIRLKSSVADLVISVGCSEFLTFGNLNHVFQTTCGVVLVSRDLSALISVRGFLTAAFAVFGLREASVRVSRPHTPVQHIVLESHGAAFRIGHADLVAGRVIHEGRPFPVLILSLVHPVTSIHRRKNFGELRSYFLSVPRQQGGEVRETSQTAPAA